MTSDYNQNMVDLGQLNELNPTVISYPDTQREKQIALRVKRRRAKNKMAVKSRRRNRG